MQIHSSDITATDNYCGAGGSTTGLKQAGIRVVHAANHWKLAIDTHNTNHPEIDHSCVDLNNTDPRYFPRTTTMWASPECTTHSPAGGRKRKDGQLHLWKQHKPDDPAVVRSRMTAMDVIRFTEFHKYQVVVVENVVEFADWGEHHKGDMFEWWLKGFHILGYEHQIVCYNSVFGYPVPTPQSRDRLFIIFHRKGNRKPNVNFCPPAQCSEHGYVNGIQAWKPKHAHRRIGKYGRRNQYIYCCPQCGQEVFPITRPAREAIDWSLPMVKIGDRSDLGMKPLSDNTRRRIARGLEKFVGEMFVQSNRADNVPTPLHEPTHTVTASGPHYLVKPFLVHNGYAQEQGRVYSLDAPTPTCTTRQEFSVALPPAFMLNNGHWTDKRTRIKDVEQPSDTVTTWRSQSVVAPPFLVHRGYSTSPECDRVHSVDEPAPTQTTSAKLYVAQPFIDAARSHNVPSSVNDPSATVTTGRHHSLITPPAFLTAYHGGRDAVQSVEQPSYTVATNNQMGVVEPFIDGYYGNGGSNASISEPCPTLRTKASHALIEPNWTALVDECGYRMLQPHEAKWLQGFPREYIMLGNQEEQYKLAGNAVPPVFAEMIGRAIVESLA